MGAGPIRISILANASQARREIDMTASSAERIGNRFAKFRAPALAALGGLALGAKKAVDAASDLNEESSKSEVIFGKQSKAIDRFASGAATSLGQSKRAALEATSTFGLIGQKAGLTGQQTAQFAKQFTTLSSDLASFNNTSPEEAIEAIGSAMRGEAEPIRKYGVLLDDATLRARAFKMGLIDSTKQALTPQQKALAASREILAQTTKAQGDFARTSDSAANKQRIIAAQTENVSASLGKSLLPAYQSILQVVSKFAAVIAQHPQATKAAVVAIAALSVAVLALGAAQRVANAALIAYKAIAIAIKVATIAWRNAQFALNIAMATNPIGLVVVAIAALVAGMIIAYKKSETFRNVVNKAWAGIRNATEKVFGFIRKHIRTVMLAVLIAITGPVGIAVALVIRNWGRIKSATVAAWNAVRNAVSKSFNAARNVVRSVVGAIRSAISTAWSAVKSVTSNAFSAVVNSIRTRIGNAMDIVRGVKGRVTGALSGIGSWLYNAGASLIQGLINGISSKISAVRSKMSELAGAVKGFLPGSPIKEGPLKSWNNGGAGKRLMEQLRRGIDAGAPGVVRSAEKAAAGVVDGFGTPTLAVGANGATTAFSSSLTTRERIDITLTAEQVSEIEKGRKLQISLDAYKKAGGRSRA